MLAIYATAMAVGGVLVLVPLLLGHHGVESHVHLGHPHGVGHVPAHAGHGAGVHAHGSFESALWLTVFSLRFWSYALAFFGLTGVLFEEMRLVADGRAIAGISVVTGAGSGLLASWIVEKLRRDVVSSLPTEAGYVGLPAEVLLEIEPDEPGRIRLSSRGSLIDLPAKSQRGERLSVGAKVVVVETHEGIASVVPA